MTRIIAPLVYVTDEKIATLVGISSWGAACGTPEWPDVYGRVADVLDWITDVTGK